MTISKTIMLAGTRRGGPSDRSPFAVDTNESNELLIAKGLPDYTEMSRRAYGWTIQTATPFAALVAVPTTVAALELWNNTSKLMIVESLFADQLVATAAAQEYAMYACVSLAKAAPSLTALTVASLNGGAPYTSALGTEIVTGVGTTVEPNGWRPFGAPHGGALAANTPMGSWEARVKGRLGVAPGRSLLLHVVGSLATPSAFQVGATVYMVPGVTAE